MAPFAQPTEHASGILAAVAVCFLALGPVASAHADEVTLTETGSSLMYPIFKVWAAEYAKTHPGVTIAVAATDSGAGVEQAISGAVQIGASDAYMSDADIGRNPQIVNVAMAISAQTVNYNIPGLNDQNLKLNGPTLAGIYAATLLYWLEDRSEDFADTRAFIDRRLAEVAQFGRLRERVEGELQRLPNPFRLLRPVR